ncbi:LacI family DNA-binding transcriptional regulator [Microlunatus panaciterrae]|uniref:DNA-binding LacI/PurR family transcriptional regulator n=1 Tax=Microlunatus panaciterrae TaxID=400768 RepID=A0ABS2REN6_9ACTN|nr:LacI family DNA-binding transcriptional regulator [Microlunatus panaciterrae]MBM7797198.1 DNA-binding LacI/PurR family transcriptional regulator [Microlunatus panaciterrae]
MVRATVIDVARLAGVSPKTVSNVVNGTVTVSPKTRARVEQALAELDYVPNLSARGLRNGRTGVIALALPDLSTPYSAEVAHHFVKSATERGWSIQIEETGIDLKREEQLLSTARAHLVDGLILNPVLLETTAVQRGVSLPPVVLIGEVDQPIADHVWVDNVAAMREVTQLLIAEGHRRIAFLGVMNSASSRLRLQGFHEAMDLAGLERIPGWEISCAQWTAQGGAQAVTEFLQHHPAPDAIVCLTDSLALGALNAVASAGLRVPEDLSIVGYDDVPEAAFMVPSLTTVSFDKHELADAALTLLGARIRDRDRPIERITVPHTIVRRASTTARGPR